MSLTAYSQLIPKPQVLQLGPFLYAATLQETGLRTRADSRQHYTVYLLTTMDSERGSFHTHCVNPKVRIFVAAGEFKALKIRPNRLKTGRDVCISHCSIQSVLVLKD